jgi:mersacidin/lichenicidin family type 2 lantibiotic
VSEKDIIRAWKDEEYMQSLSESERAALPENPAGAIELDDSDLDSVAGGTDLMRTGGGLTLGCCSNDLRACGTSWYMATYGCCPVSSDMQCTLADSGSNV